MSCFPYFEPLKNAYRQVRYFLMSPLSRTGGRVSDKSNSATSLTQGLFAPLKLSKTRRLTPKDPSRRLTLRVTARTIRSLLGTVLKRTQGDEEGRFSVGLEVFSEKSPLSIVVLQYYGIL